MHCQRILCQLHLLALPDSHDSFRLVLGAMNSLKSSRWATIPPRTVRISCVSCSQGHDGCIFCTLLQIDRPRSTEPRTMTFWLLWHYPCRPVRCSKSPTEQSCR